MKIFVKDFCETVCKLKKSFGMQVDDNMLYRDIGNQPSAAYSSLYMPDFLSFPSLNNKLFIKDFYEIFRARVVIFGMLVVNGILYCGIANQS